MIKLNDVTVKFKSFPNKETFFDHNELSVCSNINKIDFKYEDDSDLIKLMFLKKYLDETNGFETYLKIYYLPYSRMDRSENGSPFTLKYVSEFINSLNFDSVEVVEAHSDVSLALLNKSKAIHVSLKLLPRVVEETGFDIDNDYIVFPDATAHKRYGSVSIKNQLTGIKSRNFETGKIESLTLAGEVKKEGFKAILIDDLCSYGGTFLLTAQKLKELGANEIFLLTTHCENSIFDGNVFTTRLIDKVFTTDSILTKQSEWINMKYANKIKIFNIGEVLSEGKS